MLDKQGVYKDTDESAFLQTDLQHLGDGRLGCRSGSPASPPLVCLRPARLCLLRLPKRCISHESKRSEKDSQSQRWDERLERWARRWAVLIFLLFGRSGVSLASCAIINRAHSRIGC